MSLQDYKLFYEKVVEGNKTIWASTSGVPSTGDTKLTYKLNDGTTITDAQINDNYHFFYEKLKQIVFGSTSRTQIPSISDAQINVFVGDDLIFGTASVTVSATDATVSLTLDGESVNSGDRVPTSSKIKGTVTFAEGKVLDSAIIQIGSKTETLTITNGSFDFVASNNVTITISGKDDTVNVSVTSTGEFTYYIGSTTGEGTAVTDPSDPETILIPKNSEFSIVEGAFITVTLDGDPVTAENGFFNFGVISTDVAISLAS